MVGADRRGREARAARASASAAEPTKECRLAKPLATPAGVMGIVRLAATRERSPGRPRR
jgi:hypothetical protein